MNIDCGECMMYKLKKYEQKSNLKGNELWERNYYQLF